MAHRYFTENIENNVAIITGSDAVHLVRVLRVKIGEKLIICDGKGTDYFVEVATATTEEVLCTVLSSALSEAEPSIKTLACIGYAKGERMEWAIQKLVELGISEILPFFSENCVVKPKKEEEKNIRFNKIALEAAKQSGRGIIPKILMPLPYSKMLDVALSKKMVLFLYEGGGERLQDNIQNVDNFSIITGAEGGFTPSEAEEAIRKGCTPVGLGKRILRCETAPVVTLAALMAFTGNLE